MHDKMNSVVNYTSSLTSEPFLYVETKIVAELRLQGYSDKESRKKVVEDNIWGYKSIKQAKRLIPVVFRRMIFLDDDMTNILVNGNEQDSKMAALYLVMKNNRLFREFVLEVFLEKAVSIERVITKADVEDFFETKRKISDIVNRWNPNVFIKLGQVFIRILYHVNLVDGVLDRNRLKIEIINDYKILQNVLVFSKK